MTAEVARATAELAVATAELQLQEDIARERVRATPGAITKELEKVPGTVASTLERIGDAVAAEANLGRRELRLFKVCGGDGFCLPEYNLVGVTFWKAVGESIRDRLVKDGYDVKLRVFQYMKGDGYNPRPHPRTLPYFIGVEVDLRW